MKTDLKAKSLVLLSTVVVGWLALSRSSSLRAAPKLQQPLDSSTTRETKWLLTSLDEIETIKVGMTDQQLFKVFTSEGGIYSPLWGHYVYRKCPYIKVDVKFKTVDGANGKGEKIVSQISQPYLQRMIAD